MIPLDIPVLHGAAGDAPDETDTLKTAETVRDLLVAAGHRSDLVWLDPGREALRTLAARRPDLVFNLVDAVDGDGAAAAEVPGDLARLGLAFTGCGGRASLACLAKPAMKRVMRAHGLPTPDWSSTGRETAHLPRVIVKSAREHASIGMDAGSVVPGHRAAHEIEARWRRFRTPFFAEAFVEGREFNLSMLDGPAGPEVLPPAEIRFVGYPPDRPKIVDYDAKWVEGAFGFTNTPRSFDFAASDQALIDALHGMALACWRAFALTSYARVDFRVDAAGQPWILEVNTNPCLAPDAGFAAAAERAGIGHAALIARIVGAALPGRAVA